MSRFPLLALSEETRRRIEADTSNLWQNVRRTEQLITREHRIDFYRQGFELGDAQALALRSTVVEAWHERMNTLDRLREGHADRVRVDARSLVASPTIRRCSCCDAPIYYQFGWCSSARHCVCLMCFADTQLALPGTGQCLRCLEASTDFCAIYDITQQQQRGIQTHTLHWSANLPATQCQQPSPPPNDTIVK